MEAEECSICGGSRSPAIEVHDDDGERFVVCWECHDTGRGAGL